MIPLFALLAAPLMRPARPIRPPKPLLAGVASVSITPPLAKMMVPLGGYAARRGAAATGVHDPIFARALVLAQGGRRVAVVSVDLCFLPAGITQAVRHDLVLRRHPLLAGALFLSATHTHSAPDPLAMDAANTFHFQGWSSFDGPLLRFTASRIALTIAEAADRLVPVRMAAAQASVKGLNRNRRGGPSIDRMMTVLTFQPVKAGRSACVVVFAAHPTLFSSSMMEISADWPGVMEAAVEQKLGQGSCCLFLNGAEGDAAPAGETGSTESERVTSYGRAVATQALRLAYRNDFVPAPRLALQPVRVSLPEPRPNGLYLLSASGLGITFEKAGELVRQLMPRATTISLIRLGPIVLAGLPCEPTGALGLSIEHDARLEGVRYPAVVALTNDWLAYALEASEYRLGNYEAGMSFYGSGLGSLLAASVKAALPQLVRERKARGTSLRRPPSGTQTNLR
ncbi:MAG: neutral/alkaline non-lysosomal ceramidase N-terminal domain-containing protein [Armatimonadetes bacterium]|nr:neutral/alkaline non-lysosomal ceramidase N-terminal domain-containing protein [Armatimonadota bacterium]MDE2207925.1 neutral/alkaline non-lysosomal ceramidase N-terminal domain-containing protein [Armatimonadota bacterium]